jgi:hypothetical protein
MHRARAARRHAAAELGAGEVQFIAQEPQQRHLRVGVDLERQFVDHQLHCAQA